MKDFVQYALLGPLLEAAVAGLVGRVTLGQIAPGCSGAQDPKNAVEDVAGVSPGPTPAIRSTRRLGDQRFQHLPLLVGKIQVCSSVQRTSGGPLYPSEHIYEIASSHSTPISSDAGVSHQRLVISGVTLWSMLVSATRATQSAHIDHASQAAARELILPPT